jgi:hypothetical protein
LQAFAYLTILDFSFSEDITEIPDVSGLQNLEKLSFKHCEKLTKIHTSVGYLGSLKILDASSCKSLNTFPPIILTSLEQLNLSHCSKLESFPEILGKMENITEYNGESNKRIAIFNSKPYSASKVGTTNLWNGSITYLRGHVARTKFDACFKM